MSSFNTYRYISKGGLERKAKSFQRMLKMNGCSDILFMLEKCQMQSFSIFEKLIVLAKDPFKTDALIPFKNARSKYASSVILFWNITNPVQDQIHDTVTQAGL